MRLKEFFIICSNWVPISTSFLIKSYPKKIIFPFYHAVSNDSKNYISELYSTKSENEFSEDLNFLLKYFKPISIKDFSDSVNFDKKIKEPSFIITFDDGLSLFLNAAKILKECKVSSICFLNNNFIDNKELFYRFKVSLLINKIKKEISKKLDYDKLSKRLDFRIDSRSGLINWLMSTKYLDNDKIDELTVILDYSYNEFIKLEKPYLTIEQIQDLKNEGFYFGGHSFSHCNFEGLSKENQLEEIINSIDSINTTFSLDSKYFSFPFNDQGVSNEVFKYLETNDIISFGTAGLKDEVIKNHFQRIPMEYGKNYSAKRIIRGELIYYYLKRFIRKNRMKRD